jgi:enoyl-[acyl-carrier-protein] reductase (NADH)
MTSSEQSIDRRDYGRLEAEVAQLVKSVATLQNDVATMREMMQQARGGWKAIALIGGISSTITGGLIWVAGHVQFLR